MDCIVHGVAKSQTRLSDFHFHPKASPYKCREGETDTEKYQVGDDLKMEAETGVRRLHSKKSQDHQQPRGAEREAWIDSLCEPPGNQPHQHFYFGLFASRTMSREATWCVVLCYRKLRHLAEPPDAHFAGTESEAAALPGGEEKGFRGDG